MLKNKTQIYLNKDLKRFELSTEGEHNPFINFEIKNQVFYLTHAEVPKHLHGHGIGKILVEKTFEYLEQNHLQGKAVCGYVRKVRDNSSKWSQFID